MRTFILSGLAASALTSAIGAPAMAADRYVIDSAHTQVVFTVDRFGFNSVIGMFGRVEGELMLDMDDPTASSVTAQVFADTISTGHDTRNEHLRGAHWMDTANHPLITFSSTDVALGEDETTAAVTGDLVFRDQSHPVTFQVRLNATGDTPPPPEDHSAGFSIQGSFDRSEFGHATAQGENMIGDEISVFIELLAVRDNGSE